MTDLNTTQSRLQMTAAGASPRTLSLASFPTNGQAAKVIVMATLRNDAAVAEVEMWTAIAVVVSDGSALSIDDISTTAVGNAGWTDTPVLGSSGTTLRMEMIYGGGLTLRWDVLVTIESLA